jgi:two-component sensor histidine kinase
MEDFYDGLHPEDRETTIAAFETALDPQARAVYDVEYRAIGKNDGVVRWVAAKGRGVFNDDGVCIRVLSTALDITARKRDEDHLRLMVNELNHRVKNSLAAVQGIVTQTLRRGAAPEAVRHALTARLVALAKAHDVLTDARWSGADLKQIAEQSAEPYGSLGDNPFDISGPTVTLPPRTAIALALAFHELATNAAKYGALSVAGGSVRVRWNATNRPDGLQLDLEWRETGGPPVTQPTTSGFGTRLIQRGLAADLGGKVQLDFEPSGLVCTISALVAPEAVAPA